MASAWSDMIKRKYGTHNSSQLQNEFAHGLLTYTNSLPFLDKAQDVHIPLHFVLPAYPTVHTHPSLSTGKNNC